MRQSLILLIWAALVASVYCAAVNNRGLTTTFNEVDSQTVKQFLQGQDVSKDIYDAFYASKALNYLNAKPTQQSELCNLAKETLKSSDIKAVAHAAGVIATLKCTGVTVDGALTNAIKSHIDEGESFPNMYYAAAAALDLRDAGVKSGVSEDDITSVILKIEEHTEDDGSVKNASLDKDGDLYNSGLALNLFARIAKAFKLSDEDQKAVEGFAEKIENIIDESGNVDGDSLSFQSSTHDTLATTSVVVHGIETLLSQIKKKVDVKANVFTQLGNYFLAHKHASSSADAYHLVSALHSIQNNPIASPLAVVVERASILSTAKGAEGHVKVKVSDIFGQHAAPANVYLTRAYPAGKEDTVLVTNQNLHATNPDPKNSEYHFNFLGAKPDQGFYVLEFRVVPQNAEKKFGTVDSTVRRVKVTGSVSISDFEIVVSDSREKGDGSKYKAEYPNGKVDDVRADQTQFIHAQFRVRNVGGANRPLLVQQAFLRFTNSKTGQEAVFVATADPSKLYKLVVNLDEVAKSQFKGASGSYKIDVIVGDAFIQNPIVWNAGVLNVQFASGSAQAASNINTAARPVIEHQFRQPEKRPPAAVSSAFTLIVLSPLAVLFFGFIATGANIKRFPFSGTNFIYAIGFIGSIGAILGLLALYWLRLNLIQTLGYLSILTVPTLFFGQGALSHLARKA